MTAKLKLAIRKQDHYCTQEDNIKHLIENNNKLSVIITGNNHPENGIMHQVAIIGERQAGVLTKLDNINKELKGVNENHNVLLGEITRVGAKVNGFEKQGEKDQIAADLAEKKRQDRWQRWVWIVTTLLMMTGILLSNIHTSRNSRKIDNLGTPVIMNPRGTVVPLQRGEVLKMYPRDFTGDTMKKVDVKK
jgi:hypothetical protein